MSQTVSQTETERERPRDRQTDSVTDRERETDRDRETEKERQQRHVRSNTRVCVVWMGEVGRGGEVEGWSDNDIIEPTLTVDYKH